MVLTQTVVLVDAEEMELWRLKHPNESFSAWVRQHVLRDVRPDIQPVGPPKPVQPDEDTPIIRCRKNPKLQGIKVSKLMCQNCGITDCQERIG